MWEQITQITQIIQIIQMICRRCVQLYQVQGLDYGGIFRPDIFALQPPPPPGKIPALRLYTRTSRVLISSSCYPKAFYIMSLPIRQVGRVLSTHATAVRHACPPTLSALHYWGGEAPRTTSARRASENLQSLAYSTQAAVQCTEVTSTATTAHPSSHNLTPKPAPSLHRTY